MVKTFLFLSEWWRSILLSSWSFRFFSQNNPVQVHGWYYYSVVTCSCIIILYQAWMHSCIAGRACASQNQAAPKAAKTFSALEPWRCSILALSSGCKASSLCIALSRTHKLEDKTKTKSNRNTMKKTMNMNILAGRSTKANAHHAPSPSNTCESMHNGVPTNFSCFPSSSLCQRWSSSTILDRTRSKWPFLPPTTRANNSGKYNHG